MGNRRFNKEGASRQDPRNAGMIMKRKLSEQLGGRKRLGGEEEMIVVRLGERVTEIDAGGMQFKKTYQDSKIMRDN